MFITFVDLSVLIFTYFLILYLVKLVKRNKKSVKTESQQNSINFQKATDILSGVQGKTYINRGTNTNTSKSQVYYFEMSAINGVGSVTHVGSQFEWTINKVAYHCREIEDYLSSPIFVTKCLNNYKIGWLLQLYPKGKDDKNHDYLSLYIKCLTTEKIQGDITFSVMNDKNSKRWIWCMKDVVFDNQKCDTWGNSKFVQQHLIFDPNNRVLLNDTLTIVCEIVLNPIFNSKLSMKNLDVNKFNYKLEPLNDFEKLLETGINSDVTFRVDGMEIKAHKAFLVSRSPVFRAMFEHDMKEKEENVVQILDVKCHIMKELLLFIYTGKVNNIQNNARDILVVSEKYCILKLKILCEHELSKQINCGNVFELLELAATYNANFLKSQTIQFVAINKHQIADQPELKKLATLYADTICEVFRALAKS